MIDFGLTGTIGTIWFILDWIIRVVALFVVPRNRKPTAAMAWLMLIFFFPTLGLLIFLFLGSPKLPKSRRAAQKTLNAAIDTALRNLKRGSINRHLMEANPPVKYSSIAKLSHALSKLPVCSGNKVEIIHEYDKVIAQIAKDIDNAKQYVHLEYFIISWDDATEEVFGALSRAVKRGVVIRVLYDSISTKRYPKWRKTLKRLKEDGIEVLPMLPIKFPGKGYVRPDLRNHRKLVVIDGAIGFTGSQNMIRRNYFRKDKLYYDELVVRLQGPIVLQLAAVFITDWHAETGKLLDYRSTGGVKPILKSRGHSVAQILPSGPGYDDENNLKLFTSLMHTARKRITITNPYFVPDDALTTAIISAARRGVEVVMINSEIMDQWMVGHAQRSFYEVLLAAGVKIYLYKKPILLHSKFITVDDEIATVGSSNLDIRSFLLDLEVTLISYDPKVVRSLHKVQKMYMERSIELSLAEWRRRGRHEFLFDNIARLTSSLQ